MTDQKPDPDGCESQEAVPAKPVADPSKRSTLSRLGRYAVYTAPTLIVGAGYMAAQAQAPGSGASPPPPLSPPPSPPLSPPP